MPTGNDRPVQEQRLPAMVAFAAFTAPLGTLRSFVIAALSAGLLAASMSGCTVYGAKNPPTLKSTTSAEQHERILWTKVREGKWKDLPPLFAPNLVYTAAGRTLDRDQVVPYLQSERIKDVSISEMVVKPNGSDMTLRYSLQLSSADGRPRTWTAVSVWQQVGGDWILIVHAEQPQGAASSATQ